MCLRVSCLLLLLSFTANALRDEPKSAYDHQTETYVADEKGVTIQGDITITPVFSPDSSSSNLTSLVQSATSSIDIGTPGFSSWSGCTPFVDTGACVPACTPTAQRNESFPIFPALLNALHQGIKVRIITNNYETPDCPGTISPLNFLALNGADIKFYASTTFMHAKYISVDGIKTGISSINFSMTSFVKNREAGVIVEGPNAKPLIDFMAEVFETDWEKGVLMPPNSTSFTQEDLAIIKDASPLDVILPTLGPTQADYYNPPTPTPITSNALVKITTSPDYSAYELSKFIGKASSTLDIMVYQITADWIADTLLDLIQQGVTVRLLVSASIYGVEDCAAANVVYTKLYNAVHINSTYVAGGLQIFKTTRHYTYAHQKFWIVDGMEVGLSTGNLSPTDYPDKTSSTTSQKFVPWGEDGWVKANRDYTIYVSGSAEFAKPFVDLFQGDSDPDHKFPSPVYAWEPRYPIECGYSEQL